MTVDCLACDGSLGDVLFTISNLPLVDSFCSSPKEALAVPRFSVDLRQCNKCSTIQIASPPETSEIYRNYIYESSSSPDLSDHFDTYAQYISSIAQDSNQRVLEIGANDGLLLRKLAEIGFTRMVCIDPSPQTAKIDIRGVEVINDFLTEPAISELRSNSFGVIIANNCFSHIPNLSSILALCAGLLQHNGTIIIEVQSCLDLIESVVFDYIYHEHFFYHTAHSFEKLARMSGLELYQIDHVTTKGGSYRFLLGHSGHHPVDSSVNYWKYREELAGIHRRESWQLMTDYLSRIKCALRQSISDNNRTLIGYGASATGTVLMRYMDIETSIDALVDDNVKRQGLFAPGTAITVRSPATLEPSDMCLILAWRHSGYIIPKLRQKSIPYIIPLPALRISG